MAERDARSEEILRERIRGMREGVRDVPLPLIIEEVSGHRVVPWAGEERMALEALAGAVLKSINAEGIEAIRINEAGNAVESHVLVAAREQGFAARRPVAASGRTRAAGYPDLEAVRDERAFYVEVKVFSPATKDSAQRSFYLSPSTDCKVTRDAHHLLIAVELGLESSGRYRASRVRWLDLSRLRCDLKYEFNASNADLYAPGAGLVILETAAHRLPPEPF
jgi:hypothetical protein